MIQIKCSLPERMMLISRAKPPRRSTPPLYSDPPLNEVDG